MAPAALSLGDPDPLGRIYPQRGIPSKAVSRRWQSPKVFLSRKQTFQKTHEETQHEHPYRHHRRRSLRPGPASRLPVRRSQGRRTSRTGLLREAERLGRHVELHLAHRPGRTRRAGARQHVPLPLVQRSQGMPGVRRLHLRRALRQADGLLPTARSALGLHQGARRKGRRAPVHPVQHGGARGPPSTRPAGCSASPCTTTTRT